MKSQRRPVPHAAQVRLRRSLRALTIGARQSELRVRSEVEPLRAGDMQQAVHVDVKGTSSGALATNDITISFEHFFLSRILVAEDDVEPTIPTFGFGYELASDASVMLTACVRDWLQDDRGLITGAVVRVFAVTPGSSGVIPFNATAHLSFTGYAAPDGDDDDQANPVPDTPDTIPQPTVDSGPGYGV